MCRRLAKANYGAVVKDFHNSYWVEKSAVSEYFIEASREKGCQGRSKARPPGRSGSRPRKSAQREGGAI
jgi:hypothetical protein